MRPLTKSLMVLLVLATAACAGVTVGSSETPVISYIPDDVHDEPQLQ